MSEDLYYSESFCHICNFFEEVFAYYIKLHPDEKIKSFYNLLTKELDNFAGGRECEYLFFYFDYSSEDECGFSEYRHMTFSIETNLINAYDGGHVYDPAVGGDSYTVWTYNFYRNGDEEGGYVYELLNIDSLIEFIDIGATLTIEMPEEY